MKKLVIIALALISVATADAQEKMKVKLTDGTTTEFEVRKVEQVFFEGKDITITTGAVSNITENSATIVYTVANANGNVSAGIILSTNSNVNYSNKQKEVLKSSSNGSNTVNIDGLTSSTTYYYKAFAVYNGDYYYGEERSFTTAAHVEEISIATGAATNITENSATIAYTITNAIGNISAGIILSTNSNLNYSNKQAEVLKSSSNGANIVSVGGLSPSTKYYYRAVAKSAGNYYYGEVYSFTTTAHVDDILYREPYTIWGATKAQTKAYMLSYSLYQETDNQLTYIGNNKEVLIAYAFNGDMLTNAAVAIPNANANEADIDAHLTGNGYTYMLTDDDGDRVYLSADYSTIVYLHFNANNNAYYVYYYKFETSTTLYEEPYLNWGAAMSVVKLAQSSRGYTLDESSDTYLAYLGKNQELFSMYYFDDTQKLAEVLVALLTSTASVDDVRNFISSDLNYIFVAANDDNSQFFYLTEDQKSVAVVQSVTTSGTDLTLVDYISLSSLSSAVKKVAEETENTRNSVFDIFTREIDPEVINKFKGVKSKLVREFPKPKHPIFEYPL